MASWYPASYYIQPEYASFPVIHFWDLESFTRRRRRYWDAAWTRGLQRWAAVGLDLRYHPSAGACGVHGVTVSVVDIPPGIAGWTQYNPPPTCGFVEVDITTWRNAVASRNIGPLTRVVTHEVGHVLGFGHGGTGVMAVGSDALWPNAEEVAAAKDYWGT